MCHPPSTKRATISRPQWPDSNDQLSEVPGALQSGAHTPAKGLMHMRRFAAILLTSVVLSAGAWGNAQGPPSSGGDPNMQVILLGTASGPNFNAQRFGISTLVVAGREKLLFDAGRSLTTGMTKLAV